jgi:membrane protein YqaA with SNARE-associated domain
LDIFNYFISFPEYSYLFSTLIIFLLSVIPILTPPTWMVVVAAYMINPSLDPIVLSMLGASAAIGGRLVLFQFSSFGRKFINETRKSSLDRLKTYLEKTKYGYFLGTMIFALTPLPSNMLFISYGIMKAKSIGIITGFWIGRFIVYLMMINISRYLYKSFSELFKNDIIFTILVDIAGITMTLLVIFVNWEILISQHKLVFIKPKIFFPNNK